MSAWPVIALGFPFPNVLMLFGAAAAAIPIIIHLWNRRKHREVVWAAMTYLLAAMQKHSRRITIEQLILLAIRVSILLMLAFALADPFLDDQPVFGSGFSAGGETHYVIVIDGSYSMDYRDEAKSRFALAKDLAIDLVDDSTDGDGFTILMMADPPEVIVREPAFAADDVVEELTSLQLTHGGANLHATLAMIEEVVDAAQAKHDRLKHTQVLLMTDLGRTTWDEVESAECRDRIAAIAAKTDVILLDVGQAASKNVAITKLDTSESLITIGRDVSFRAEIENVGAAPVARHKVEFIVDGQSVHSEHVDLTGGGRANATLVHRFSAPGEHLVEVRTEDDPLGIDNHRWVSVPVRDSIRVLCIEGVPGDVRHVAIALEPSKSVRRRVRTTIASESAILETALNDYDCIFLCNVAKFSEHEADALRDFLRGGGGLVFCLGDQVQPDNYNRELGQGGEQRILPVRLGDVMPESRYTFDPLEFAHPIVDPFRGHPKSGLEDTPVWKYIKLTRYDDKTAKVALAFNDKNPAIVEEQILNGRCIVYAGAVSDESIDHSTDPPTPWTRFHRWASFVPLMQEILTVAVSGRAATRNLRVGEDLEGVVYGQVREPELTVVGPDGRTERAETTIDGSDFRWSLVNPRRSGIYQAQYGSPLDRFEEFAVNVDTRESRLDRFDNELLPSQIQTEYEAGSGEPGGSLAQKKWQIFQLVLAGILGLLLLETLLAWRFGRVAA